jgi:hypothetical protein
MIPNRLPETPGAIRARLAYLRNRKVVLDELIQTLERYAALEPPVQKVPHRLRRRAYTEAELAGAA